jgi:hypothetical protein
MNGPAPPRKGTGALQHAPIPKALAATRYSRCEHSATRIELMPTGHVHHGKEVCSDCDRLLRWIPKPRTVVRRRFYIFRLVKLAMCEGLTPWELAFIRNVSQARKLSPRQQQKLDALCARYLEGNRP